MKVMFNSIVNNSSVNFIKKTQIPKKQNLDSFDKTSLECLSNYNLAFCSRKPRTIYVINYDGTYEKEDNISKAEEKYGRSLRLILAKTAHTSGERTFVYADEIENEDGVVSTQAVKKAIEAFKLGGKQPVYAIDFHGKAIRYDNISECAEATNVAYHVITSIIRGEMTCAKGYVFAKAYDLEMRDSKGKLLCDENDNPVLDVDTICKLRESFLYRGNGFPIAKINKDGKVEIFKDYNEIVEKTKCSKNNLVTALNEEKPYLGSIYTKLSDVVAYDENGDVLYDADGNYEVDYDCINEYLKLF